MATAASVPTKRTQDSSREPKAPRRTRSSRYTTPKASPRAISGTASTLRNFKACHAGVHFRQISGRVHRDHRLTQLERALRE